MTGECLTDPANGRAAPCGHAALIAGPGNTCASLPDNGRNVSIRDRPKRDPFLFLLCLGAFAFMTWAFALTWWVTGGVLPLALALVSVAPALGLFYLRDARGRSCESSLAAGAWPGAGVR